jgi:hypothetical protein
VIAHIRDRATTSIYKRDQTAPTLAFQRRVVPPDPLCCLPFGIDLVQLKVIFSRYSLAKVLFLISVHEMIPKTLQPRPLSLRALSPFALRSSERRGSLRLPGLVARVPAWRAR